MENEQTTVYCSNGAIPEDILENFSELFPEHDELALQEILLAQDCVYESLQADGCCQSGGSKENDEPSNLIRSESEKALDEAIALSLRLGDSPNPLLVLESTISPAGNSSGGGGGNHDPARSQREGGSSSGASQEDMHQDITDPDSMSYEQLLELGNAIGSESKGLPRALISRLPTSKHKTSLFSKKRSGGECVICYEAYRKGDTQMTLPCMHMYHSKCISRWLEMKKNCPFCSKEVEISYS